MSDVARSTSFRSADSSSKRFCIARNSTHDTPHPDMLCAVTKPYAISLPESCAVSSVIHSSRCDPEKSKKLQINHCSHGNKIGIIVKQQKIVLNGDACDQAVGRAAEGNAFFSARHIYFGGFGIGFHRM